MPSEVVNAQKRLHNAVENLAKFWIYAIPDGELGEAISSSKVISPHHLIQDLEIISPPGLMAAATRAWKYLVTSNLAVFNSFPQ